MTGRAATGRFGRDHRGHDPHLAQWEELLAELLLWPHVRMDYVQERFGGSRASVVVDVLRRRVGAVVVEPGPHGEPARLRLDRAAFERALRLGQGRAGKEPATTFGDSG